MNSTELNKKAALALLAILFFIAAYIILFLLAVGLVLLCGMGAFMIISIKPMFITFALGAGVFCVGLMVLFFLIKFLFKKHSVDRSSMIEITEAEQPKLFQLVRELTTEIKTEFPKKIYLSSEVNASVFYDSSFWSMFLPVRKNLLVGLGLVNSVTEAELKAILAHEFGHFSQKSMKIGSYVYHVNQIIHNLLFDNESFDTMVQELGNVSEYFILFAKGSVKIIEGIQLVLVQLYKVVNLSYLELSREMEFNADAVAASVAGSKPLIDSLLRMELADISYNNVAEFYARLISENKKAENFYLQHSFVMHHITSLNKLEAVNGLPVVTQQTVKKLNRSLVVIKDQWSSHPSIDERIERLSRINNNISDSNEPAWNYFTDIDGLQKRLTEKFFEPITYSQSPELFDLATFKAKYHEDVEKNSFHPLYNGFYDRYDIERFDTDAAIADAEKYTVGSIEEIYNDAAVELQIAQNGLINDIQLLDQINAGEIKINTFDYDGKKYKANEAFDIAVPLKKQKEEYDRKLNDINLQSFCFFYKQAQSKSSDAALLNKYHSFFEKSDELKKDFDLFFDIMNSLQFTQVVTPFDQIRSNFLALKDKETVLKSRLSAFLDIPELKSILDNDTITKLNRYIQNDLVYFYEPNYNNENTDLLSLAVNTYFALASQLYFIHKKDLLDFQISLLH